MTVNVEGLGKITASKYVLNEIVTAFYSASDAQLIHNRSRLSERSSKIATEIFDALNKEGYYKRGEVL